MSAAHADPASAAPGALSRRSALGRVLALAGLAFAPLGAFAAGAGVGRSLRFAHTHTGETLCVEYYRDDAYRPQALAQVDHLLRDFRTGAVHPIDPNLLDILYALQFAADRDTVYEVISGYRSPATNAALRRRSTGVAEHSMHLDGRAIDVRGSGLPTTRLYALALSLQCGGVGLYRQSDFVHVDTGRVRAWSG